MCGAANRIRWTLLWLALLQTGCTARSQVPAGFRYLDFENSSPDLIRIALDLGDREVPIGRVAPMTRVRLRIREGALPPDPTRARIRATALATPEAIRLPARGNPQSAPSDWYPIDELVGESWRYSGSRIVALPQTRS